MPFANCVIRLFPFSSKTCDCKPLEQLFRSGAFNTINLDDIDNESSTYFSYIVGTINDLSAYTHSGFAYNDMFDSVQQQSIEYNAYVNAYQQGDINEMKVLHDNPWENV